MCGDAVNRNVEFTEIMFTFYQKIELNMSVHIHIQRNYILKIIQIKLIKDVEILQLVGWIEN